MVLQPNATQKEKIRHHLEKYGSISSWTAIKKYRITRISQYIMLLRNEGYVIENMPLPKTNAVNYTLKKSPSTN